jgi:coproporphyrinogen III oxidase-like Fe-S oxidoreductase
MGVGAGAVGFLDNTRFYPSTDIDHYLQNPLEIRTEILTSEELLSEKIFLGFRSCVGVKKNILTPKQQKQADLLATSLKQTGAGRDVGSAAGAEKLLKATQQIAILEEKLAILIETTELDVRNKSCFYSIF